MMLRATLLIFILWSCSSENNSGTLNTVIELNPSLSTTSVESIKCWDFYKHPVNSAIVGNKVDTLKHAISKLYKNSIEITISGCNGGMGHGFVKIQIIDSCFQMFYTETSDVGHRDFFTIQQQLILNKFPFNEGDTVKGSLRFKGNAFLDGLSSSEFAGNFSVIARGDTSATYFSIEDGIGDAKFVNRLELVGLDRISELTEFKNLRHLDITDAPFDGELPHEIFKLKNLESLTISTSIDHLPEEIGDLVSLKKLSLWGSHYVKTIPASLKKCSNLQVLNLRQNKRMDFTNLVGLNNLKVLDLSENDLVQLPSAVRGMKMLEEIAFRYNKGLDINNAINLLSGLDSLIDVDIRGCQIKKIPESIVKLKSLSRLNITENPLSPQEIQKLKKLLPDVEIKYSFDGDDVTYYPEY